MPKKIRVTYVRSAIGRLERQKRTIVALGLRRLGDTVDLPDSPSVRGMVASVSHLVEVEEVAS
ncbi:MAG: 50S ribosomal protein L30 [Chloroflexi bacterium]|nr:50S ribosomal protein L30 [Chloroflexota bacterium]